MVDISWLQVLIGFAGGAVTATLINKTIEYWNRPIICARLVPNIGCYVETDRFVVGNPMPNHKAVFLRLQIKNTGLSSIKECAAYITHITKVDGGLKTDDKREVLELKWSHYRCAKPRDIPRDAFFYIDIALLDRIGPGNNLLSLGADLPQSLAGLLSGRASFNFEILIAADNAKPVPRSVSFDYDPATADLLFSYDRPCAPTSS